MFVRSVAPVKKETFFEMLKVVENIIFDVDNVNVVVENNCRESAKRMKMCKEKKKKIVMQKLRGDRRGRIDMVDEKKITTEKHQQHTMMLMNYKRKK